MKERDCFQILIIDSLEKGNFFPADQLGLQDPVAPDDVQNSMPLADEKIANAEWQKAGILDVPGTHGQNVRYKQAQTLVLPGHTEPDTQPADGTTS